LLDAEFSHGLGRRPPIGPALTLDRDHLGGDARVVAGGIPLDRQL
jgi:hypothetical protein